MEGWKSLDADSGDYSGHRLLADTYSAFPRHEPARVSELLQAQLLQPVNVTPVPPSLAETDLFILERSGPSEPAFSEFNPLFNRNRIALLANGAIGGEHTRGDEATISGVWNRLSFSVGQFHYVTNGFRDNNQQDRKLYNAFVQAQVSRSTSVQAEARAERVVTGDLIVNFDPTDFSADQVNRVEGTTERLGLRHVFSPKSMIIASLYFRNRDTTSTQISADETTDDRTQVRGWTGEARHFYRSRRFALTSGGGHFGSDRHTQTIVDIRDPEDPFYFSRMTMDEPEQTNLYTYSFLELSRNMTLTVGASGDFYRQRLLAQNQFNPKFGFAWRPTSTTTVRMAAFQTLNRPVVSSRTTEPTQMAGFNLEPTQVAGFNQLFADGDGVKARRYGVAVDHKFNRRFFAGGE